MGTSHRDQEHFIRQLEDVERLVSNKERVRCCSFSELRGPTAGAMSGRALYSIKHVIPVHNKVFVYEHALPPEIFFFCRSLGSNIAHAGCCGGFWQSAATEASSERSGA